jgi:hypothetical protein
MSNEIATPRAMALAEMTNNNELLIQKNMRQMVDKAIESGLYLIELKEELPHGQFMSFCEQHVRVKKSQINNYMVAAQADPTLVLEYKESEEAGRGLIGLVNKVQGRQKSKDEFPPSGNLGEEPLQETAKKELTEEDCRRELEKPMYNRGEGVDLFDFSHAFMNKVNTMFRDKSLRKMAPSEFAELLYEAMTYSDWGQPVEASMIREEIDHIERFTRFMNEVVKHLNKPTVQEVRNV